MSIKSKEIKLIGTERIVTNPKNANKHSKEHWKKIPGSLYLISSKGRIRNIKRTTCQKPELNKDGYHLYNIHGRKHQAHRLVADAFIGGLEKDLVVNHIDFVRSNNNVENLEICTVKENAQHSANGGRYTKYGMTNNNCKYDDIIILTIRTMIMSGFGDTKISKMYEMPRKYINDIKLGKIRSANKI